MGSNENDNVQIQEFSLLDEPNDQQSMRDIMPLVSVALNSSTTTSSSAAVDTDLDLDLDPKLQDDEDDDDDDELDLDSHTDKPPIPWWKLPFHKTYDALWVVGKVTATILGLETPPNQELWDIYYRRLEEAEKRENMLLDQLTNLECGAAQADTVV